MNHHNIDLINVLKDIASKLDALLKNSLNEAPDAEILNESAAFRCIFNGQSYKLYPIYHYDNIRCDELKGIDGIIAKVKQNTEQFIKGLPANNVLLWGARGTGKSSTVKAMLNEYSQLNLKIIEVDRDDLLNLNLLIDFLRTVKHKFIIFCDDLSFQEEEKGFTQLKAVLEGGLEQKPLNIIIYATSNRRTLMAQHIADNIGSINEYGELHPSDAFEEKVSLRDRFGLKIGFTQFSRDTYIEIVKNYAALRQLNIKEEELIEKALQWSLNQGGFTGRTAKQFINDIEGKTALTRR
ncbi:ATPase AAA [Candidatus Magnetoovum chiemensis]|nr:ATPase AAA [Candidatus Magnetoovum chiemensis]